MQHFTCKLCSKQIGTGEQYLTHPLGERQSQYHQACYEKQFYEECAVCHRPVSDDRILHASGPDGRKIGYHVSCFRCGVKYGGGDVETASPITLNITNEDQNIEDKQNKEKKEEKKGCGKVLEVKEKLSEYLVERDTVYCHECYELHFLPACVKCNRKIKGELSPTPLSPTSSVDGTQKKIRYLAYKGAPYCVECYDLHVLPTCHSCKLKIRPDLRSLETSTSSPLSPLSPTSPGGGGNRFLSANEKCFHVDCFKCRDCQQVFDDMRAYLWKDENLYCVEHYQKRAIEAGMRAASDHKMIQATEQSN